MTKSALIIYRVDKGIAANAGVVQKLIGQVQGLTSQGWDVDYIIHDGHRIYKNQEIIVEVEHLHSSQVKWTFWNHLLSSIKKKYTLIMIRYTLMIPPQYRFITRLRMLHTDSKIFLDMPTYPYDDEWEGLRGYVGLFMDKMYRDKLKTYIDAVVHSGKEVSIFDIRTIPLSNGISTDQISNKKPAIKESGVINMIAIGKWQFWHGLDRLLKGIGDFVKTNPQHNVHLHIVGDGPELQALKVLSTTLNLSRLVKYHGTLLGGELEDLINQCDIGIGTLGLHRKGVGVDSSLKHRLYCAQGIPFVLNSYDCDFTISLPFVFYIPADESNIEIHTLIEWFDRLDKESTWKEMTSHARNHLTWPNKMKQLEAHIE